MQATVKGTVFGFGPVKHGIAALGIVAALAVGAVTVSTIDRDDAAGVQASRAVSTAGQAKHPRFLEFNTQLPSLARPATRDYRFAEINMLPGDEIAVRATSTDQIRYLEMNMLPETAPVTLSAQSIRFRDINLLPGDDQPNIAPYSNSGESKY